MQPTEVAPTAFGRRRTKLMVNIAAMDKRVGKRAEYETWAAGLAEALSGGVTTPAYVGFIGEEGEDGVRRVGTTPKTCFTST